MAFDDVAADAAVMKKLSELSTGSTGKALIEAHAISGAEAQTRFRETTTLFNDQLPKYQEMQKKFYDEYWSRA
jgi:hypothetical protein